MFSIPCLDIQLLLINFKWTFWYFITSLFCCLTLLKTRNPSLTGVSEWWLLQSYHSSKIDEFAMCLALMMEHFGKSLLLNTVILKTCPVS